MSRLTVGQWLVGVGIVHELVGVLAASEHLWDIVQAGVVGVVTDDQPWRMAIFWFEAFGLVLMLLGAAWDQLERHAQLTRSGAVGLALLGLVGVIVMPVSGFWTTFPLAALAWQRAGHHS